MRLIPDYFLGVKTHFREWVLLFFSVRLFFFSLHYSSSLLLFCLAKARRFKTRRLTDRCPISAWLVNTSVNDLKFGPYRSLETSIFKCPWDFLKRWTSPP